MNEAVLTAKRESKHVDFKRSFDPESAGDWCEVLKDIVAMANVGGGTILIGVANDGTAATDPTVAKVLALDPATLTDKVASYTGAQFDSFSIVERERNGVTIAMIAIGGAATPLVFSRPGTFQTTEGKQKVAFSQGTLYVRHGAKSEPATTVDVSHLFETRLQKVRREWMSGVRKVVSAPTGSQVSVLPAVVTQSAGANAVPIRITDNPTAPEYRLVDPDVTHPWRGKELIAKINEQLPDGKRINQFHIRALRHLYEVDGKAEFFHKGKFSSPQYSAALYQWLLDHYARDRQFFAKAADEFRRQRSAD